MSGLGALLDSALAILASEGLDAVTLGRVAREVDLVPAALYRYFPSSAAAVSLAEVLFLVEFYLDLPALLPGHHGLIAAFLGDPCLLLPEEEARQSAPRFALLFAEIESRPARRGRLFGHRTRRQPGAHVPLGRVRLGRAVAPRGSSTTTGT